MVDDTPGPVGGKKRLETKDWRGAARKKARIPGIRTGDAAQQQLLEALKEQRSSKKCMKSFGSEQKVVEDVIGGRKSGKSRAIIQRRAQGRRMDIAEEKQRLSSEKLEKKALLYEKLIRGEEVANEEYNVDFKRKCEADEGPSEETARMGNSHEHHTAKHLEDPQHAKRSDSLKTNPCSHVIGSFQQRAVGSNSNGLDPFQALLMEESLYQSSGLDPKANSDPSRKRRRDHIKCNYVRSYLAQARIELH